MANKQMKRCPTTYIITKLKSETMRYHYTVIKMAKIQSTDNNKVRQMRKWSTRNSHSLLVGMQNGTATVGVLGFFFFFSKLNILLPCNLAITLLGTYPKELKTCPHNNRGTEVYSSFIQNCQIFEETKTSFGR